MGLRHLAMLQVELPVIGLTAIKAKQQLLGHVIMVLEDSTLDT